MRKTLVLLSALCLIGSFGGAAAAKEVRGSQSQAVKMLKAAGSGGSAAQDKTCQGAGNCLDLLDRVGVKCKTWICNPGPGGPNCWCDL